MGTRSANGSRAQARPYSCSRKAPSTPPSIASSDEDGSPRNGESPTTIAAQSSTSSRPRGARDFAPNRPCGIGTPNAIVAALARKIGGTVMSLGPGWRRLFRISRRRRIGSPRRRRRDRVPPRHARGEAAPARRVAGRSRGRGARAVRRSGTGARRVRHHRPAIRARGACHGVDRIRLVRRAVCVPHAAPHAGVHLRRDAHAGARDRRDDGDVHPRRRDPAAAAALSATPIESSDSFSRIPRSDSTPGASRRRTSRCTATARRISSRSRVIAQPDSRSHGDGRADRLDAAWVTADFFHVLGVDPARGRPFTRAEDTKGNNDVASPQRCILAIEIRRPRRRDRFDDRSRRHTRFASSA